jgi:hypothetical protein
MKAPHENLRHLLFETSELVGAGKELQKAVVDQSLTNVLESAQRVFTLSCSLLGLPDTLSTASLGTWLLSGLVR